MYHRDGVRIECSVTRLCRKVTTLKEHVSELETVCGKIQKEMAEMVRREVKVARGKNFFQKKKENIWML